METRERLARYIRPAISLGTDTSSRAPSTQSLRPPRLKAACENCNVAKVGALHSPGSQSRAALTYFCLLQVKCSGQRSGCDRCVSLSAQCIYTESRVGKVGGPRGKRKKTLENEARARLAAAATATGTGFGGAGLSTALQKTLSGDIGRGCDLFADLPGLDIPDLDFGVSTTGMLDSGAGLDYDDIIICPELELTSPPGLSDRFSVPMMSSASSCASSASPGVTFSPYSSPRGRLDSRRVQTAGYRACTESTDRNDTDNSQGKPQSRRSDESSVVLAVLQLASALEEYIAAGLALPDIVLGITRRATDRLASLAEALLERRRQALSLDSPSTRIFALFIMVLEQTADLLEAACDKLLAGEERDDSTIPLSPLGMSIGAFGSFQPDPSERRAWQAGVVVKEVRNAVTVLGRVGELAGGERVFPELDEIEDRFAAIEERADAAKR